jgi:hypothetical protein
MADISSASKQQSEGIDQINSAVEQMNRATQYVAGNAEQSASASEELRSQAAEMKRMVEAFRLSSGGSEIPVLQSRATRRSSAQSSPQSGIAGNRTKSGALKPSNDQSFF